MKERGKDMNEAAVPVLTCRACGKPARSLSNRGLCELCGVQRMADAVTQLHKRSGPAYERQRAGARRAAARRARSEGR